MDLAEGPLAWLPFIHGRHKHLIISSEAFQDKKKVEHDSQAKARKHRDGKRKGKGRPSKGIRYTGVSGKGKGKSRPQRNVVK